MFVTADHGEEFFGTYRSHGTDLSEQVMRVPLLRARAGLEAGHGRTRWSAWSI